MTRHRLPESEWISVGIYLVRTAQDRLVPSHARGDQHAEAILIGAYPLEWALADRRSTLAMLEAVRISRRQGRTHG